MLVRARQEQPQESCGFVNGTKPRTGELLEGMQARMALSGLDWLDEPADPMRGCRRAPLHWYRLGYRMLLGRMIEVGQLTCLLRLPENWSAGSQLS